MILALLLSGLAVLALAVLFAIRQRQVRQASPLLQGDAEGELAIPVTAIRKGAAHNSLYPALAIAADGLRFKVLGEGHWLFTDIQLVVVARTLFGASLTFESRYDGKLIAQVASLQIARQAVAALPAGLTVIDRTVKAGA
jgi:hypothetical protein